MAGVRSLLIMNKEKTIESWQKSIISECEKRLNRTLTEIEERFITSRGGFLALEAIEDTISSTMGKELEKYLNSESDEK